MITWLVLLAVIGSAIWVDQDARKLVAAGASKDQMGNSPLTWSIATILLWIVAFPWYLNKRGKIRRELGLLPNTNVVGNRTVPTASPSSLPQAGWFADPTNALQQRYWDGQAWTDQVRVAPPQMGSGPV